MSVRPEFEKLLDTGAGNEIVLWFEYELFCQANLWFTVSLLKDSPVRIFLVLPSVRSGEDVWEGFGQLDAEGLRECYEQRRELSEAEIEMYADLWEAFRSGRREDLKRTAGSDASSIPLLPEACLAAADFDRGPQELVLQIMEEGITEFSELFPEFNRRAGVFRLGDTQVRKIFESLK